MSTFTHLARAVLGIRYHSKESLFAMMTCYFDESLEEWTDEGGKPRKFTFVCGYVASVEQWEGFEVEWRKYLDSYEIQDFHMTDYCSFSGEFKKWKGDKFTTTRTKFMQEASEIVRKFARYGFVSMLSHGIFNDVNRVYKLEEACGSPYGVVGRACADMAWARRAKLFSAEKDMEYVFEDGGPDKGGLSRAMTDLCPAFPDPIFKPGKTQKPTPKYPEGRNAVLQLQAADYLAYEIRKLFADQIKAKPVRGVRLSFKALTPIHTAKNMLTDKSLRAMCEQLGIELRT